MLRSELLNGKHVYFCFEREAVVMFCLKREAGAGAHPALLGTAAVTPPGVEVMQALVDVHSDTAAVAGARADPILDDLQLVSGLPKPLTYRHVTLPSMWVANQKVRNHYFSVFRKLTRLRI